ncbi:MAG: hypothetical protein WC479_07275 [Candidatus Izemoplasmatales bacterium]
MEEEYASLSFDSEVDEIEAAVLLPEDWYITQLLTAPKEEINKKKTGKNWVFDVRTLNDDPVYSGRRFRVWLPLPMEADKKLYDSQGNNIYDAKKQSLASFCKAFEGQAVGKEVSVSRGSIGQIYIIQGINPSTHKLSNNANAFMGFKPAPAGVIAPQLEEAQVIPDDEIPF